MTGRFIDKCFAGLKKVAESIYHFLLAVFVIVIVLYVLSDKIFLFAHKLLIVEDPVKKADVIIIPSGGFGDERLIGGIKLFKEGYADKIILTGSLIMENVSTADIDLKKLIKAGISAKDVFLNRDAESTYDNAVESAQIMTAHGFKKAILVTSPYHTRRSRWTFRKVFGRTDLEIIVVPIAEDKDMRTKYRVDSLFEEVVFEYQKFLMYWFKY